MTKVITKPFAHGEEMDKARNVTGINKWARSSPVIGTFMLIMGWFTIPFEVIFRKDFGQRWFTIVSFITGALLVCIVEGIQFTFYDIADHFQEIPGWLGFINPFEQGPDAAIKKLYNQYFMLLFFCLYFYMGAYHLFKIKWRNQAKVPLHSFDDGRSRLKWAAFLVMWIFNIIATPVMFLFWILIPSKQRSGKPFPWLFKEEDTFTNVFFEPGAVLILGILLSSFISFYLLVTSLAMFLHAHWKEMARKAKIIDFQDSKVEAELMRELRKASLETGKEKKKPADKKSPSAKAPAPVIIQHPPLSKIIDDMRNERIDTLMKGVLSSVITNVARSKATE
ncbi:hypothetical protein [Mucilaginibacter sp. HD30]